MFHPDPAPEMARPGDRAKDGSPPGDLGAKVSLCAERRSHRKAWLCCLSAVWSLSGRWFRRLSSKG